MLKKIVLWACVLMLSFQIFTFSSATAAESSNTSGKITEIVVKLVKIAVPASAQTPSLEENIYKICHVMLRKAAHFSLYALLASLTLFLARSYQLRMRLSAAISAFYCLLYAISDEVHQLFVDGRSGQIEDVFLDFGGAIFGICISILMWYLFVGKKQRQR